jgi:hypothetical protein
MKIAVDVDGVILDSMAWFVHFLKNPPIWRRVLISNDTYLGDFHESMENWFDWSGFHIHDFIFFLDPHDDIEVSTQEYDLNEYGIRLCDVFREELRTILYMYEPGDNWLHRLTLEKGFPHDGYFDGPLCIGGEGLLPQKIVEVCGLMKIFSVYLMTPPILSIPTQYNGLERILIPRK